MCGIVGILRRSPGQAPDRASILAMRDVLTHRGPDDAGVYQDGPVGLGHRRLSIIDIGSGHQPMIDPSGERCVVFNGEIYNYRALRSELEAQGFGFRTQSDTEVLLHGYAAWGDDLVGRLNGIFAFAIWDRARSRLFLARDHMGVKPLYYHHGKDAFVFASEIKALFESGFCRPECNWEAVPEYFVFRQVAGERTLFRGVKSLLPGHRMTVDADGLAIERYWSPEAGAVQDHDDVEHRLETLVVDAVRMQMMSDVPLGTFCSGGVDSSLVTAIAARHADGPINTYSIGFDERDYDESAYARRVAEHCGTVHHELRVSNEEFASSLPGLIWHNDEPLHFANSVHIHALSRLAKERVTVVLTGEGADELFGGYPRYRIPRLVARLRPWSGILRAGLSVSGKLIRDHRLEKLGAFLAGSAEEAVFYNNAPLPQALRSGLVHGEAEQLFPYRSERMSVLRAEPSRLRQAALLDQQTYLGAILNRQDKMSMAASIESRVPLLDHRLVSFANGVPDRFKQHGSGTKIVFKRLAEKYLPREVIYRRKSGFGVPLAAWLRAGSGLGALADSVLGQLDVGGIDGCPAPMTLLGEHRAGRADHAEFLWTILNFGLWKARFGI